jgi:hypothetical protein
MRMAGARYGDARREVDVASAIRVDEIHPFATIDHQTEGAAPNSSDVINAWHDRSP